MLACNLLRQTIRPLLFAPQSSTPHLTRMASSTSSKISSPTGTWKTTELSSIRYGPGSLTRAIDAAFAEDVPTGSRALIVTGQSLNNKTDVIKKVKEALGSRFVAVVDTIGQHAPVEAIRDAVELVRKEKIDVLVSVGGGSPIDSAKAISYYIHEETDKGNDDPMTFMPSIAIPTTLSVAETTQNAGYTENRKKVGVSHPALVPRVLILDAELTLATPEKLWLSSGMRAVDHAIESLYRPGDFNYVVKHQYLGAIRELFPLLRLSKQNPQDVNIRQRLQLAVIASLFPEARKGALGLSHGLGHALGSTYSIPHGVTSCLTLGAAIKYTAQQESTQIEQLASLADALSFIDPEKYPLGKPVGSDTSSQDIDSLRKKGIQVGEEVDRLVADLGLTTKLSEWKVPEGDYEHIAEHVTKTEEQKEGVLKLLKSIT